MPEFISPAERQRAQDLVTRLGVLAGYAVAESIDGDLRVENTAFGAAAETISHLLKVLGEAAEHLDYWIDLWKKAATGAMGCKECEERFTREWRNKIMEEL